METVILLLMFWIDPAGQGNNLAVKFDTMAECEAALPKTPAMLKQHGLPVVVWAGACTELRPAGVGL